MYAEKVKCRQKVFTYLHIFTMRGVDVMAENISKAHVLLHPMRLKIMQTLHSQHHLVDIAERAGVSERLAAYHLLVLSREGLVTSEYQVKNINGTPRVVKYYDQAPQAQQTVDALKTLKI